MRKPIGTFVAVAVMLASAGAARADARAQLAALVMHDAEQDFDLVRDQEALSGSAPLSGLKTEAKPSKPAKRSAARATARVEAKQAARAESRAATLGRP
jgi:hypothetical protein